MKILLTGSSGFIGSYFINHFDKFDKKFGIVTLNCKMLTDTTFNKEKIIDALFQLLTRKTK